MYVDLLLEKKESYVAVNLVVIAACQLWQPSGDDGAAAQWFQMVEMLPTIISLDEGSRILSKRVLANSHNFRFRSLYTQKLC